MLRLVLEFRMNYVEHHLVELKQQILASANNPEQMMAVMKEYKDMQTIRNAMAKQLGSNIL